MAKLISSLVGEHDRPHMEAAVNVRFGSWLCKNATALRWRGKSIPRHVISRRRNFVGLFGAINFGKLFSSSLDFRLFEFSHSQGQKAPFDLGSATSGLFLSTDIARPARPVRFVPMD
jgi:hypothetical protein